MQNGERRRLVGLMLLAFWVLMAYGAVEPICDSLLIEAYGKDIYPWVWLATLPLIAAAVSLYAWCARRVSLLALFLGAVALSALALTTLLWLVWIEVPWAALPLYLWKDVHIVVLLETVWAWAAVVTPLSRANWHYGALLVVGSAGSILGALLTGGQLDATETSTSLLLPVLLLWGLLLFGSFVARRCRLHGQGIRQPLPAALPKDVGSKTRGSRYVGCLLLLVISVQTFITLVDFQYKASLEAAFPRGVSDAVTADRTRVASWVGAAKDGGALLLQLLTGPLLRALGHGRVLLWIPVLSFGVTFVAFCAPRLEVVAASKVIGKAIDYSLFKAAKEILYIPLSYREITWGKAWVDMAGYRGAKSGVSVFLVALSTAVGLSTNGILGAALAVVVVWFAVTWHLLRRSHGASERPPEVRAPDAARALGEARLETPLPTTRVL